MSTAFYPLSMNKYNNRRNPHNYETWKGTGIYKNPTGTTKGNIRPITNNDLSNVIPYKFGSARPIKHWRKGSYAQSSSTITLLDRCCPDFDVFIFTNRLSNTNRSSTLVSQLIDQPGGYTIRDTSDFVTDVATNTTDNGSTPSTLLSGINNQTAATTLTGSMLGILSQPQTYMYDDNSCPSCAKQDVYNKSCPICSSIPVTSNYKPTTNLTQNPLPRSQTVSLCCNEQRKALKRVRPASTNLSKNYYTTSSSYLQNRCQTYKQRAFNFVSSGSSIATPGTPQALSNTYVANCYPTTCQNNAGCKEVIYKPSNPQFAIEGGVSSSARTMKLATTTAEQSKYYSNLYKGTGNRYGTNGGKPNVPFIMKSKEQPCEPVIAKTFWRKPTGGTGQISSCGITNVATVNQSRGPLVQ